MKRTLCAWCACPLTHRQIIRRRTYCSRSCAKAQWHAQHRDRSVAIGKASWQPGGQNRARYIARLRAALVGCASLMDAYRRGYHNGYTRGATWRRKAQRAA